MMQRQEFDNVSYNYNNYILLKFLAFSSISVIKSVLVLFPTFLIANRPGLDTVQSTWLILDL